MGGIIAIGRANRSGPVATVEPFVQTGGMRSMLHLRINARRGPRRAPSLALSAAICAVVALVGCVDLPGPLPAYPDGIDGAIDGALDGPIDVPADGGADVSPPLPEDDGVRDPMLPDAGLERCNRLDDDGDGRVDEALLAPAPEDRADDDPTRCRPRVQRCIDGVLEVIVDRYQPEETACDGLDNDCDGMVDEGREAPCTWCDGVTSDAPCNGCPDRVVVPAGFVCVPAGAFEMGSPEEQPGRDPDEGPVHTVRFEAPFLLDRAEMNQGRWLALLGADATDNPAWFSNRAAGEPCADSGATGCPVERVSWYDAVWFANQISRDAGLRGCYTLVGCVGDPIGGCLRDEPGCVGDFVCERVDDVAGCDGYRLPTEAEWARAARAGSNQRYWAGDGILALTTSDIFRGNSGGRTRPFTAAEAANDFGLRDVHGNVGEWVRDGYGPYPDPAVDRVDPLVPDGHLRVSRGGSWDATAEACRSAAREAVDPRQRSHTRGFRLARSVAPAIYVVDVLSNGRGDP